MSSIILITAHRRPGFLSACLSHIQKAESWEQNFYLFALDNGGGGPYDIKCREVIESFPGQKKTIVHNHRFSGNSTNTLKGYREAFKIAMTTGADLIHLIEDDIFISPDYFTFHEAAHNEKPDCFYVSACRNQNVKGAGTFPGTFQDIYSHRSYQSLGVSFSVETMPQIIRHETPHFYANMPGYLREHFPKSIKKGYHTEQDGLIFRILEATEKTGIFPIIPRAYHAGFTGYNRPASQFHKQSGEWNNAGWKRRGEMLMEMTQDEMNRRAGRAEYRDITKYPDTGERTGRLNYVGNAQSILTRIFRT